MPTESQPLISSQQIKNAFVIGGVSLLGLVIAILILATARPQGRLVAVDESVHQAKLADAQEALTGFALVGEGARLDIQYAMGLIVERGVDTPIYAGGVIPAPAPVAAATAGAPAGAAAAGLPDGAAIFQRVCAGCHQATGRGIPGAFPPLAGHVGLLIAAERAYPAKVVMFGLLGEIQVKGNTYRGVMPGLGSSLNDAEVAAVLNHVATAWDAADASFTPYTADEIAAWRTPALQMTDTATIRRGITLP